MSVRVGINGFGRIGRQSLKALIERAPDIEVVAVNDIVDVADERAPVQARLHLRRLSRARSSTPTTRSSSTATRSRSSRSRDPSQLPWGDLGVDIVIESTGLFTDADEGPRAPRRRRQEGAHQRPGQEGGRHDRPRRERRRPTTRPSTTSSATPAAPRTAWRPAAKVVHDSVDHRARPDEHDPLVHQRPAHPRRRPQGPAPRPRRRPEHHPDHDRRREGARPRDPRSQGQVRRLQPARPDPDRLGRRLHRRARAGRPRVEELNAAFRAAAAGPDEGDPRRQRRAARLDRLPRRHPLLDHRQRLAPWSSAATSSRSSPGTTTSGATAAASPTSSSSSPSGSDRRRESVCSDTPR